MSITILGPQRFRPTAPDAVRSLAPEGTVATVTAAWREREPDDAELDELLDGRTANLGLYARRLDVMERDPAFAEADRARGEALDELQALYTLRLHHAMEAVYAINRREGHDRVTEVALEEAFEAVRQLDTRHSELVDEVHAEFDASMTPRERPLIAEHVEQIHALLADAAVLAIAGGHVGSLLACLRLFSVVDALHGQPIVAWSAGAMALTDRVVIFHDRAPQGYTHAEVFARGLGLLHGLVALPHARRRLRIADRTRMAAFARRFSPAHCVVLDDSVRLDCLDGEQACPPGARVITADGRIEELEIS